MCCGSCQRPDRRCYLFFYEPIVRNPLTLLMECFFHLWTPSVVSRIGDSLVLGCLVFRDRLEPLSSAVTTLWLLWPSPGSWASAVPSHLSLAGAGRKLTCRHCWTKYIKIYFDTRFKLKKIKLQNIATTQSIKVTNVFIF